MASRTRKYRGEFIMFVKDIKPKKCTYCQKALGENGRPSKYGLCTKCYLLFRGNGSDKKSINIKQVVKALENVRFIQFQKDKKIFNDLLKMTFKGKITESQKRQKEIWLREFERNGNKINVWS